MTKLPLSVTTGPAVRLGQITELPIKRGSTPLATAILRVAFGDRRLSCKLRKTLAYAKGTTSIGTPGLN